MYKFQGIGTTHFVVEDEATDTNMTLKLRIHSFLFKMVDGQVRLFWKEFMRDEEWQPRDRPGWPVFLPGAKVDLADLKVVPTLPIANFPDVTKRLQVTHLSFPLKVQDILNLSVSLHCEYTIYNPV